MKICTKCGSKIGIFSGHLNLKDGVLCSKCKKYLITIGAEDLIEMCERMKYEKFISIVEHKEELNEKFDEETAVGELLKIDFKNKILNFDNSLLEFSNIAGVETQEHWEQKETSTVTTTTTSKKKGGVTRGLIGGMLFGPAGALVGAGTAKTKSKSESSGSNTSYCYCSHVTLTVTLKDYYKPYIIIDLDPTDKELSLAQCVNVETYAMAIKRSFEQIIENVK